MKSRVDVLYSHADVLGLRELLALVNQRRVGWRYPHTVNSMQVCKLSAPPASGWRLDDVVFDCGCDVRWIQLWQQRREAELHRQQLYCYSGHLPRTSVTHRNLTVVEGANITVACNGSGSPLPEVDWTVGGLHSINTHQSNVDWPNVHSINLTLVNMSREDNGFILTCIAENVVGMSNASIELTIQFPPTILKLEEPERRHDTCMEFTVWGYPHPTLRWIYKGKELPQTEYVRVEKDVYQDFIEGCLTFTNPTHHNNGNYTLVASNSLGTATRTVYAHFLHSLDESPTPPLSGTHQSDEDTFGVSIAVGLAGFACVLLLVLFVLINKYGRRSKFGMKDQVISGYVLIGCWGDDHIMD
ncbi:hypothetical protein AAFF_G00286670 [Aldrovandia affinis]|uniref:Ig-like domain-containing protein n=1 Tax=Aldrovandia affinis TaxID=143900 RepID=A0AAD7TAL7_9TELE|nr:hypothetical protein AAFF_G00286670 [Aldrovandia affinis]